MKKKLAIAALLMCWPGVAGATNYYVKNGGSDLANGLSDATAWATEVKVNSFVFSTGDDVFFKCGDEWQLTTNIIQDWAGIVSNPAIIGAYYLNSAGVETVGVSGSKPILHGVLPDYYPWYDTHDGGANQSVLADSNADWPVDKFVGYTIKNVTDNISYTCISNTATTVTMDGSPDWDDGDIYRIGLPVPNRYWFGIVQATDKDYSIFQDLDVRDSAFYGLLHDGSPHGKILRCVTSNTGMAGIMSLDNVGHERSVRGGLKTHEMAYNDVSQSNQLVPLGAGQQFSMGAIKPRGEWIHHNLSHDNDYGETFGVYANGLSATLGDSTVEWNWSRNNAGEGVYLANVGYMVTTNNHVSQTVDSDYYMTGGPGIMIGSETSGPVHTVINNLTAYNVVQNCITGFAYYVEFADGDEYFQDQVTVNNTFSGNAKELNITSLSRYAIEDPSSTGNLWENNIHSGETVFSGYVPTSGITFDYNGWSSSPPVALSGEHDFIGDMLLDSQGRPRNPAIWNAGTFLDGHQYFGSGPAIGAWDYSPELRLPGRLVPSIPAAWSMGDRGRLYTAPVEYLFFGADQIFFGADALHF